MIDRVTLGVLVDRVAASELLSDHARALLGASMRLTLYDRTVWRVPVALAAVSVVAENLDAEIEGGLFVDALEDLAMDLEHIQAVLRSIDWDDLRPHLELVQTRRSHEYPQNWSACRMELDL